jgi:hypothetical protein
MDQGARQNGTVRGAGGPNGFGVGTRDSAGAGRQVPGRNGVGPGQDHSDGFGPGFGRSGAPNGLGPIGPSRSRTWQNGAGHGGPSGPDQNSGGQNSGGQNGGAQNGGAQNGGGQNGGGQNGGGQVGGGQNGGGQVGRGPNGARSAPKVAAPNVPAPNEPDAYGAGAFGRTSGRRDGAPGRPANGAMSGAAPAVTATSGAPTSGTATGTVSSGTGESGTGGSGTVSSGTVSSGMGGSGTASSGARVPPGAGRTVSPWAPTGRPGRSAEAGTEQLGRVRSPLEEPLTAPFGSVYANGGPRTRLGGRPVEESDGGPPTQLGAPPFDERDADGGPPTQLGAPPLGDQDDEDDTYRAPAGLATRAPVDSEQEPDEEDEGTPQGWAVVIGQWIAGALVGAAAWVGFRYLWFNLPVVALAAAVIITVGLVIGVRALLRNDDLRTTAFAVGVGLLLTVSPAILVLLER